MARPTLGITVSDIIHNSSTKWDRAVPASPDAIRKFVADAEVELPQDYISFLFHSNGGEGELSMEPGWFQIWPAEKVVELNRAYEVHGAVPGFFGFGSSGGGELLAFDFRAHTSRPVVVIPFIPMDADEAVVIAPDFITFVRAMGYESNDA